MEGYYRYIDWKPVSASAKILQIYSKGLEYALVSDDYKQCHPFVWCKDFLHDAIYATINNKWVEIYKFRFDPSKDPLPCMSKIRLLLTNSKDKKFAEKIPAVLDFINQIEERLKIKKTIVRKCWLPPESYRKAGVFMFEGSRRWIQAPPMLSLYSLLLRVGFCHTAGDSFEKTLEGIKSGKIKPYQKKDGHWFKNTEPAFEKILRLGDRKIFDRNMQLNYPSNLDVDSIHNKLGIIGFATDMVYKSIGESVIVPHWHYDS